MTEPQSDADFFASVVAEIENEAQIRATSGEYPRALLRTLDEEFRRWLPDSASQQGIEESIRGIELASYVDPVVPIDSRSRLGRKVKYSVRRLTYFYHRHITQQITVLGIHITRPLRLLDASLKQLSRRLTALEDSLDVNTIEREELLAGLSGGKLTEDLSAEIVTTMSSVTGRILMTDSVDLDLLRSLQNPGQSAYGVGPAVIPGNDDLELRYESATDHLNVLPDQSLAGLILTGMTDRLSLNEQLRTLRKALNKCAPGARIVIIITLPKYWEELLGPVGADLLDGRPLHPETWVHLLKREHAENIEVCEASDQSSAAVTAILK